MKRFLVVFITDGTYATEVVHAQDIAHGLSAFELTGMIYDSIHSITTLSEDDKEDQEDKGEAA